MTLEEWEASDDEGWVEWPTFPENENKFDWSLSYEQIEKQYNPSRLIQKLNLHKPRPYIPPPAPKKKKKPMQSKQGSIVGDYLRRHAADVHLSVNTNTPKSVDKEYQEFLAHQTPEQFELAKKHGWRIARLLTDPEPNFHYQ